MLSSFSLFSIFFWQYHPQAPALSFSLPPSFSPLFYQLFLGRRAMGKRRRKLNNPTTASASEEVSSMKWEFICMSEQEEDLISRMYNLVGNRWGLIAGRVPGRNAEEIERFWIMKHDEAFDRRSKRLLIK